MIGIIVGFITGQKERDRAGEENTLVPHINAQCNPDVL